MIAYFIRVPDLEPQTLIHYNEIFKETLKNVYGIIPEIDYIDRNKDSLYAITEYLPEDYRRGCTIHCREHNAILYGYDYEYLKSRYSSLIEVNTGLEKCEFIGAI